MTDYYSRSLHSNRLKKCYEIAPARVRQHLEAEIAFVKDKVGSHDVVLDLGCGYGRVSVRLVDKAKQITGIDTSEDNINLAREIAVNHSALRFYIMNALDLKFDDSCFDLVFCIQNGISAFHVDSFKLVQEAIRVTRKGGTVLFSSYSESFWEERLNWFRIQADSGLIGEIDHSLTKDGIIVCKDGFKAKTFSCQEFLELASHFAVQTTIHEIDNSCVFCEMVVK